MSLDTVFSVGGRSPLDFIHKNDGQTGSCAWTGRCLRKGEGGGG